MEKMSNIPERAGKKRIVIIGAGFGGLNLVNQLNKDLFQIVVLDKHNYHQFQPLLYQVAIAGLEVNSVAYPLRKHFQKKKNVYFRMCKVSRIVPEENKVETGEGYLDYDYLVIAVGCNTNFFGNKELEDKTIPLKWVSEALYARNRILESLEEAASAHTEEELEKKLNFVIVGGGATGVELSGAIADMRKFALPKDYPEIDFSKMKIHVIDGSDRLLSGMSPHASEKAKEALKKRGVILHQEAFVTSYENGIVTTSKGEKLYSDNVVWVAGIIGTKLPGIPEEKYTRGARLKIDSTCRLEGYQNIYAIGDISCMETEEYPHGHPQMAQVAIQMARRLAKNLFALQSEGKVQPFVYDNKGSLATIGRNDAVADLGNFKLSGILAWWLWLWVHLLTILGVKNKLLIFIDWAWNYFTYDLSLRILIKHKKL